ncbi:anti-sigma factor [Deinococcus sp. KSM4-11]|nr:anti-sigma factor [Deinococcus sp. KSM4-11]
MLASALGQLSPAEEAALQEQLKTDPALQQEWQALHETLSSLLDDLDLEQVTIPADAEDRLIARLHVENLSSADTSDIGTSVPLVSGVTPATTPMPVPTAAPDVRNLARRSAWWLVLPLGLAAAVALLFALRPSGDPLERYAHTPGAVSTPVLASGQPLGTLVRLANGRVFVQLNRPADPGRTYQLWQIQAGTPVSLGVFDEAGLLTAALPPHATIAVSVEPAGGSPQPTTKPLFAQSV